MRGGSKLPPQQSQGLVKIRKHRFKLTVHFYYAHFHYAFFHHLRPYA